MSLDDSAAERLSATDRTLVRRVRTGDEQASAELYDRYARRLLGLVSSQMADRLRARTDPEDIVQSVFRSVFRGVNAGNYDAPDGSTLWQLLAVIAVHKVRRTAVRQHAARRDDRRTQGGLEALESAPDRPGPEAVECALREAVEGLGEMEREVVLLRVQGHTVEEIADMTGRSRRTVERLLQRARENLVDLLDRDE